MPRVAEQAGARGEVDDRPLRFLQVWVAFPHVVEGGVQAGIHAEIEMILGLDGQRDARCGRLGVVDQHVDAPEDLDGLSHHLLDPVLRLVVGGDVRLQGQHPDAVEPFQLLLGVQKLLLVASGQHQIRALLGVGDGDAVTNGFGFPAAGDNGDFSIKDSHAFPLLI